MGVAINFFNFVNTNFLKIFIFNLKKFFFYNYFKNKIKIIF
jgi:hypothetical protein